MTLHLLVVSAVARPAVAQCVPVLNPGFESGPIGRDVDIEGWNEVDTPDVVEPGGFVGTLGGTFIIADGIPASPVGGRMAVFRNSPYMGLVEGVWQELNGMTPGLPYRLTFYQANAGLRDERPGNSSNVGPGHFEISIGDDVIVGPAMTFDGFGSQSWNRVDVDFVPTESATTLSFDAAGFVPTLSTGRLALDGIVIQAISCSPADVAEPFGILNVDDIDVFVTSFLATDLLADCDGNGILNVDDIDCFVASFLAGCP